MMESEFLMSKELKEWVEKNNEQIVNINDIV